MEKRKGDILLSAHKEENVPFSGLLIPGDPLPA
jgi:hypothetical protein